jgi:hypothetical protein
VGGDRNRSSVDLSRLIRTMGPPHWGHGIYCLDYVMFRVELGVRKKLDPVAPLEWLHSSKGRASYGLCFEPKRRERRHRRAIDPTGMIGRVSVA